MKNKNKILIVSHNKTSLRAALRISKSSSAKCIIISNDIFKDFIKLNLKKIYLNKYLISLFFKEKNSKSSKRKINNFYNGDFIDLIKYLSLGILDILILNILIIYHRPKLIGLTGDKHTICESYIAKYISLHIHTINLPYVYATNKEAIFRTRGISDINQLKIKLNKKKLTNLDIFYPPYLIKTRRILRLIPPNPFLIISYKKVKLWFKSFDTYKEYLDLGGDKKLPKKIADLDVILSFSEKKLKNDYKLFLNLPHFFEDNFLNFEEQKQLIEELIKPIQDIKKIGILFHPKSNPNNYLKILRKFKNIFPLYDNYYKYITKNSIFIATPSSSINTAKRLGAKTIIIDPLDQFKNSNLKEFSDFYISAKEFKKNGYKNILLSCLDKESNRNFLLAKEVLTDDEIELKKLLKL